MCEKSCQERVRWRAEAAEGERRTLGNEDVDSVRGKHSDVGHDRDEHVLLLVERSRLQQKGNG